MRSTRRNVSGGRGRGANPISVAPPKVGKEKEKLMASWAEIEEQNNDVQNVLDL